MDVHFQVRKGDVLYQVESFLVTRQEQPCPPEIFTVLVHKIHADLSRDSKVRQVHFPFKMCPIHATLEVVGE